MAQEQEKIFSLKSVALLVLACLDLCFGQSVWKSISTLPQGNNLNSVTYGKSQFVAVGNGGVILTSPDAITWNIMNSGTLMHLNSLTYGDSQFVAVGDYGMILTSPDARTWTIRDPGVTLQTGLYSVAYGDSQFVIVGGKGNYHSTILTSPDAMTWTMKYLSETDTLRSVIYCSNQFVAVGDSGTVLTSPDAATWTIEKLYLLNDLYSIIYGNGQFVAVGFFGAILTSSNASSWKKASEVRPLCWRLF